MPDALKKLTIRGFKSIREAKDLEFRSINVLIGANGAGKSNLISFFQMLGQIVRGQLDDYIRSEGGVGDLLFNGRKVTDQMEFETRFGVRGYRFKITPGPSENAAITDEARYYDGSQNDWRDLNAIGSGKSALVEEAQGESVDSKYSQPVYDAISSWKIYHFHDTSATADMRHAEIAQDNMHLRQTAKNIAPFLLRLRTKEPSVYKEIVQSIQLVIPYFDDFTLTKEHLGPKKVVHLTWRQSGSDFPMQPYHLSDGSIRFICLATALLQPTPPSCLILDEPELGLHPAAIQLLAELIKDASQRTQLIISTQSPELVNCFEVEDIIVVSHQEGESTFERLDLDDYSAWLDDYTIGELWSKNVIRGGPIIG